MPNPDPQPSPVDHYRVFLASPGDMDEERQVVREFFADYNRTTAASLKISFDVIDWENYADAGVGRPQELITRQTLDRYRDSLVLVVGLMGQRFGSPSGAHESGTEEELQWALESHMESGWPEIKSFFTGIGIDAVASADLPSRDLFSVDLR